MKGRASAKLDGIEALNEALMEFGLQMRQEVANVVNGTSQNIRTHAIKSIQRGPKSGRIYQLENPKRTHQASAPGEAPATDTGLLAGSIEASIDGLSAEVSVRAEYAEELEFGRHGMAARPFLIPAMEKERPAWDKRVARLVSKALSGIKK